MRSFVGMKREVCFAESKRGVLWRQSEEFCGDKARSFVETKGGVLWRRRKEFSGDEVMSFAENQRQR